MSLVRKLLEFKAKKDKHLEFNHIHNGLISGFPSCCIIYFCYFFHKLDYLPDYSPTALYEPRLPELVTLKQLIEHNLKTYIWQNNPEWGYIPCPICQMRNNRVEVIKT